MLSDGYGNPIRELTILYEYPVTEGTVDVAMESYQLTHPKEPRDEDDLRYEPATGHWHVTRRVRCDDGHTLVPTAIPRERVSRVAGLFAYDAEAHEYEPDEADWKRIQYDTDDPEERLLESPDERHELAGPITYDEETDHWTWLTHNPHYREDGTTFVHRVLIPRERVFRVNK